MNYWNAARLKEALPDAKLYNFPENWSSCGLRIWHDGFVPENMILVRGKNEKRGVIPENHPEVLENAAAIISSTPSEYFKYNKPIIEFKGNSGNIIIQLARYMRQNFQGKVISVTGSSGKSTTTKIIYDILSSKYKTSSNLTRENTSWGLSWNMTCFDINAAYWVIETSLGGGMSRNSAITKPDYAIVMNVAPVHLTGNMQVIDIAEEKSRIFNAMRPGRTAILYREMQH